MFDAITFLLRLIVALYVFAFVLYVFFIVATMRSRHLSGNKDKPEDIAQEALLRELTKLQEKYSQMDPKNPTADFIRELALIHRRAVFREKFIRELHRLQDKLFPSVLPPAGPPPAQGPKPPRT